MKELKYIKIILNILILVNVTTQQILPPVPCPQIFSYKYDQAKNEYYGELTINPNGQTTVTVYVNLTVDAQTSDYGSLALLHGLDQAKLDLVSGRPIHYKIQFPPYNIPRLTLVVVNGAVLCNGPDPKDSGFKTSIQHHLTVTATAEITKLSFNNNQQFTPNLPNPVTMTFAPPLSNFGFTQPQQIQHQSAPARPAPSSLSTAENCGTIATAVNLAIGGETIKPGSWPWLAAVFAYDGQKFAYICAGTLVSSRIVISAAHCFKPQHQLNVTPKDHVRISLGKFNMNDPLELGAITEPIQDIQIHSGYRSDIQAHDADVAVVILISSVPSTSTIRPACMLENDYNVRMYTLGYVVGWGKTETLEMSPTPQRVKAEIVDQVTCLYNDGRFRDITTNRTLCAGSLDGKGPCAGDSGSGLLVQIRDKWYLRGVVSSALSNGNIKCDLYKYVVYADIPSFSSWILSYIDQYR